MGLVLKSPPQLSFRTWNVRCAGISVVYLAGESSVTEGKPALPYSESCVAGGNKSDEAQVQNTRLHRWLYGRRSQPSEWLKGKKSLHSKEFKVT